MEIESIDINHIIRSIKKKYPSESKDRIREIVSTSVLAGVSFRNQIISTSRSAYQNKITSTEEHRFYFICPKCDSPVRKIYAIISKEIGCRACTRLKAKTSVNTQADRVMKIQKYIHELYNGHSLSYKKKTQLTNFIINHYNSLDDKYKFAYNTFVFKELQNWCLDTLVSKSISPDYKKAIKDVLTILKSSKQILVKTGLAKTNKKI